MPNLYSPAGRVVKTIVSASREPLKIEIIKRVQGPATCDRRKNLVGWISGPTQVR